MSRVWQGKGGKPQRRFRRKPRCSGKGTCWLTCSSCGRIEELHRWVLARPAKPRCPVCGGPLNRFREA